MSDDTKTWEGETHGEVKTMKFTGNEKAFDAINSQDKIIRNLTIQRNLLAFLTVLFFLLAIKGAF